MKKVVLELPKSKVAKVENCSNIGYYGIKPSGQSDKGFIARKNYNRGPYHTCVGRSLTNGNTWGDYSDSDLKNLISELIKASFEVYEFDTHQELFKWLSE